ncbi:MAG: S41 family peptidase [Elusimicrobiota bacterium]
MLKKKVVLGVVALALVSSCLLFFSHTQVPAAEDVYQQWRLITEVYELITRYHVEPVEGKKLLYGAASGMVRTLDPFSQFMEPETHKEMRVETEGEFGGLGIRISIKDKLLTVVTPLPGTPAYRAGIQPGDKIVKIENVSTEGMDVNDAVKKLRGAPGTKVTITVWREGEKETFDITLTREVIKLEAVRNEMLDKEIAYIWILELNAKVIDDLRTAMVGLKEKGMKALVLDLRYDPGGLLNQAVEVCKLFIGGNKMIVYTQGRDPSAKEEFRADIKAVYGDLPVIVLVNKGSASGAEIIAGAIQDHKRGVVIGTQTFGKASVQRVFPLSDGSGLRLTTAKYYTPLGRLIHEKGITPDIEVTIPRETEIKIREQKEMLYQKDADAKSIVKKDEHVEDIILQRAIELLKARNIFQAIKEEQ